MSNYKLVDVDKINTHDEYLVNLVACAISLQTMAKLNMVASRKGLFDPAEMELANALIWECKRAANYAQQIIDSMGERFPIEIEEIIKRLRE